LYTSDDSSMWFIYDCLIDMGQYRRLIPKPGNRNPNLWLFELKISTVFYHYFGGTLRFF